MISFVIKDNPTLAADDYEVSLRAGIGKQYTYYTILGFRIAIGLHQKEIGIK